MNRSSHAAAIVPRNGGRDAGHGPAITVGIALNTYAPHPMIAPPAAERARAPALDAAVSTLEVPGLGQPYGMFVMADGTRLVSTEQHTLQLLTPAGQLALIARGEDEDAGFENGKGANARFNNPCGITVDAAGHIVVVDMWNHALRRVSKAGEVSTLAGNGEPGLADGKGDAARFNGPALQLP